MVHVIANLQLQPGVRAAFLAEFAQLVPRVRAEQGCLAYDPTIDARTAMASQDPIGDDCVIVVEQWASVAALKAHDQAPHMREFRERTRGMVVARSIRMLEPV